MSTTTLGNILDQSPLASYATITGTSNGVPLFLRAHIGNWVGVNEQSVETTITPTAGQGIQVTIPTSFRRAGDQPDFVVIEGSTVAGSNYRTLAIVYLKDATGIDLPLPLAVDLDSIESLDPYLTVADLTALSAFDSSLITNGKRVFVTSEGSHYQYYAQYGITQNGASIIDASPSGTWVKVDSGTVQVVLPAGQGGFQASPLNPVSVIPFVYDEDLTDSYPLTLLLRNGFDANQPLIPLGTRIQFIPYLDGSRADVLMSGKVRIQLLGYTDALTGGFTAIASPEVVYDGTRNDILVLPQDLPSGSAAVYTVKLNYAAIQLPELEAFSTFTGVFGLYSQAGTLASWTDFTGDFASNLGCQRRLLPSTGLIVESAEGAVAVKRLASGLQPSQVIAPLIAATANQVVVIDGNGNSRLAATPSAFEAEQGIVSTESGYGPIVPYLSVTVNGAEGIEVIINHPTDGVNGTIRADYPDETIQGKEAVFNPVQVRVFLSDGTNDYFIDYPVTGTSQTETITALGTTQAITSEGVDFGLYASSSGGVSAVAGGLPAGTYAVTVAYVYNGGQVTRIDNTLPIYANGTNNAAVTSVTGNQVTVNRQTLSSSIILNATSALYQYFEGTGTFDVILEDPPTEGRVVYIRNIDLVNLTLNIRESVGGASVATLSSADSTELKFVYEGVEWQGTAI